MISASARLSAANNQRLATQFERETFNSRQPDEFNRPDHASSGVQFGYGLAV